MSASDPTAREAVPETQSRARRSVAENLRRQQAREAFAEQAAQRLGGVDELDPQGDIVRVDGRLQVAEDVRETAQQRRRDEQAQNLREELAAQYPFAGPADVVVGTEDGQLTGEIDPDVVAQRRQAQLADIRQDLAAEVGWAGPEDVVVSTETTEGGEEFVADLDPEAAAAQREQQRQQLRERVAGGVPWAGAGDVVVETQETDEGMQLSGQLDPAVVEQRRQDLRQQVREQTAAEVGWAGPEDVLIESEETAEGMQFVGEIDPDVVAAERQRLERETRAQVEADAESELQYVEDVDPQADVVETDEGFRLAGDVLDREQQLAREAFATQAAGDLWFVNELDPQQDVVREEVPVSELENPEEYDLAPDQETVTRFAVAEATLEATSAPPMATVREWRSGEGTSAAELQDRVEAWREGEISRAELQESVEGWRETDVSTEELTDRIATIRRTGAIEAWENIPAAEEREILQDQLPDIDESIPYYDVQVSDLALEDGQVQLTEPGQQASEQAFWQQERQDFATEQAGELAAFETLDPQEDVVREEVAVSELEDPSQFDLEPGQEQVELLRLAPAIRAAEATYTEETFSRDVPTEVTAADVTAATEAWRADEITAAELQETVRAWREGPDTTVDEARQQLADRVESEMLLVDELDPQADITRVGDRLRVSGDTLAAVAQDPQQLVEQWRADELPTGELTDRIAELRETGALENWINPEQVRREQYATQLEEEAISLTEGDVDPQTDIVVTESGELAPADSLAMPYTRPDPTAGAAEWQVAEQLKAPEEEGGFGLSTAHASEIEVTEGGDRIELSGQTAAAFGQDVIEGGAAEQIQGDLTETGYFGEVLERADITPTDIRNVTDAIPTPDVVTDELTQLATEAVTAQHFEDEPIDTTDIQGPDQDTYVFQDEELVLGEGAVSITPDLEREIASVQLDAQIPEAAVGPGDLTRVDGGLELGQPVEEQVVAERIEADLTETGPVDAYLSRVDMGGATAAISAFTPGVSRQIAEAEQETAVAEYVTQRGIGVEDIAFRDGEYELRSPAQQGIAAVQISEDLDREITASDLFGTGEDIRLRPSVQQEIAAEYLDADLPGYHIEQSDVVGTGADIRLREGVQRDISAGAIEAQMEQQAVAASGATDPFVQAGIREQVDIGRADITGDRGDYNLTDAGREDALRTVTSAQLGIPTRDIEGFDERVDLSEITPAQARMAAADPDRDVPMTFVPELTPEGQIQLAADRNPDLTEEDLIYDEDADFARPEEAIRGPIDAGVDVLETANRLQPVPLIQRAADPDESVVPDTATAETVGDVAVAGVENLPETIPNYVARGGGTPGAAVARDLATTPDYEAIAEGTVDIGRYGVEEGLGVDLSDVDDVPSAVRTAGELTWATTPAGVTWDQTTDIARGGVAWARETAADIDVEDLDMRDPDAGTRWSMVPATSGAVGEAVASIDARGPIEDAYTRLTEGTSPSTELFGTAERERAIQEAATSGSVGANVALIRAGVEYAGRDVTNWLDERVPEYDVGPRIGDPMQVGEEGGVIDENVGVRAPQAGEQIRNLAVAAPEFAGIAAGTVPGAAGDIMMRREYQRGADIDEEVFQGVGDIDEALGQAGGAFAAAARHEPVGFAAGFALPFAESGTSFVRGFRGSPGRNWPTLGEGAFRSRSDLGTAIPEFRESIGGTSRQAVQEVRTRMGEATPDAIREQTLGRDVLQHTTADTWAQRFSVGEGASELPGMFGGPEMSFVGLRNTRLGGSASWSEILRPSRPNLRTRPDRHLSLVPDEVRAMPERAAGQGYAIRRGGEVVETGLSRGQANRIVAERGGERIPDPTTAGAEFMTERAQTGTAYVKPEGIRSPEIEAAFPPQSEFVRVGRYGVDLEAGPRIPGETFMSVEQVARIRRAGDQGVRRGGAVDDVAVGDRPLSSYRQEVRTAAEASDDLFTRGQVRQRMSERWGPSGTPPGPTALTYGGVGAVAASGVAGGAPSEPQESIVGERGTVAETDMVSGIETGASTIRSRQGPRMGVATSIGGERVTETSPTASRTTSEIFSRPIGSEPFVSGVGTDVSSELREPAPTSAYASVTSGPASATAFDPTAPPSVAPTSPMPSGPSSPTPSVEYGAEYGAEYGVEYGYEFGYDTTTVETPTPTTTTTTTTTPPPTTPITPPPIDVPELTLRFPFPDEDDTSEMPFHWEYREDDELTETGILSVPEVREANRAFVEGDPWEDRY